MDEFEWKRKYYEDIAFQINREDSLINNRLIWTLQLNGFIFAALAFTTKDTMTQIRVFCLLVLPVVGFFVSASGLCGVVAAHMQIENLKNQWISYADKEWVMPFGKKVSFYMGLIPSIVPQLVLITAWLFLLYINYNTTHSILTCIFSVINQNPIPRP